MTATSAKIARTLLLLLRIGLARARASRIWAPHRRQGEDVTAILQNGVWSRMKGGHYEKKGLDEMPGAEVSTRNVKYAVRVHGAPAAVPVLPDQTHQV